jgi:hypothetical protein
MCGLLHSCANDARRGGINSLIIPAMDMELIQGLWSFKYEVGLCI